MIRNEAGGADAGRGRPHPLIRGYERLADTTHRMLAAARAGDWVGFDRLLRSCRQRIGRLKLASREARLDRDDEKRRVALLQEMLSDDAQIRALREPQTAWIDTLLKVRPMRRGAAADDTAGDPGAQPPPPSGR